MNFFIKRVNFVAFHLLQFKVLRERISRRKFVKIVLQMSFFNDADRLFGTTNLYEILHLNGSKLKRKEYKQADSKFNL